MKLAYEYQALIILLWSLSKMIFLASYSTEITIAYVNKIFVYQI